MCKLIFALYKQDSWHENKIKCFYEINWLQSWGACRLNRNRNGNWNANWNRLDNSNADGRMAYLSVRIIMKLNHIYHEIYEIKNLILAWRKARKGKTRKPYVIEFERNLGENLRQLKFELMSQTYHPKSLKIFILRDPKTRKISKSAFKDRIVRHALCNIIEPILDKIFIYDSHANQIGKGTHKALERFDKFKRKVSRNNTGTCYVLKADIKHYFQEVSHEILIDIIKRNIEDKKVIWLIEQILSNTPSGGGAKSLK